MIINATITPISATDDAPAYNEKGQPIARPLTKARAVPCAMLTTQFDDTATDDVGARIASRVEITTAAGAIQHPVKRVEIHDAAGAFIGEYIVASTQFLPHVGRDKFYCYAYTKPNARR